MIKVEIVVKVKNSLESISFIAPEDWDNMNESKKMEYIHQNLLEKLDWYYTEYEDNEE